MTGVMAAEADSTRRLPPFRHLRSVNVRPSVRGRNVV